MLVLRRKANQSVIIDEDIKVTVLSVEGQAVKIGIEAPNGVTIVREELVEADKEKVNV